MRRRRGRPFRCRRHALLGLRAATAPPDRRGPCGSVLSLLWPCLLCSVLRSWYVSRGLSVLQSPTPPTIRPVLSESERPTDAWCAGWGRAGGVAPAAAGNCAPYHWPRKQLVPAPIDICKGAHLTIIPSPLPPPLPPPLSLSPPLPPSLPPSLRPTLPPWPSLPSQPPTVPPTYPFNLLRLASWEWLLIWITIAADLPLFGDRSESRGDPEISKELYGEGAAHIFRSRALGEGHRIPQKGERGGECKHCKAGGP